MFRIAVLGGYTVVLGGGSGDRGPRVKSVQKVVLWYRCYRTFRGKRCFFIFFCEI